MNDSFLSIDFKAQQVWAKPLMWLEMSFGAIGGGLFLASLYFQFNLGLILGFLLLIVGKGILLMMDLGRPARFLRVLGHPKNSWIGKGSWGFLLFGVFGLITVLPLVFTSLSWSPWSGIGRIFGLIAAVFAIFLIIYDGFFLGDSKGVAFWNTPILPVLFGASALAGGFGFAAMLPPFFKAGNVDVVALSAIHIPILLLLLICLYTFITAAGAGNAGAQYSVQALLHGKQAVTYKSTVVVIGLVLPLIGVLIGFIGQIALPTLVWGFIGGFEASGTVALRYCVLRAGAYSPLVN